MGNRIRINLVRFSNDTLLEIAGQLEHALKVGVFVEAEIVALEQWAVDVAAEVAIESGEDGLTHGAAAVGVDV